MAFFFGKTELLPEIGLLVDYIRVRFEQTARNVPPGVVSAITWASGVSSMRTIAQ
jgi:hypothetical protein